MRTAYVCETVSNPSKPARKTAVVFLNVRERNNIVYSAVKSITGPPERVPREGRLQSLFAPPPSPSSSTDGRGRSKGRKLTALRHNDYCIRACVGIRCMFLYRELCVCVCVCVNSPIESKGQSRGGGQLVF